MNRKRGFLFTGILVLLTLRPIHRGGFFSVFRAGRDCQRF